MPRMDPKLANILLERFRADLEEINRRIRIMEWLAAGEQRKGAEAGSR